MRPPTVVALDAGDRRALEAMVALSTSAHWNQNAADWSMMLALGEGWGLVREDRLVASALVLPYEPFGAPAVAAAAPRFAWVSMVLVLPEFRGQGLATQVLRLALDHCAAHGRIAGLDATPAGHDVYVGQGFVDTWSFARWRRSGGAGSLVAPSAAAGVSIRPLERGDWPAIARLDGPAFGADRSPLLRRLAARQPALAHVAQREGHVVGYVAGREGRTAVQIGPLVAPDEAVAVALFDAALAVAPGAAPATADVVADLPDARRALAAALTARGFTIERPFTRMVHGATVAPGDPATVMLVAGPELG